MTPTHRGLGAGSRRRRHSQASRTSPLVVIGLTLLAALLRLIGLGQQSIWSDELHTLLVAGIPFGPEVPPWRPSDLLVVTQGPLFMGLAHAWSGLVGTGEAALRLLPALFGIATVPVFLGLADRMLDRRAAAFAGLLIAVSPFHVWYSQELRGYSLVILAAVIATLVFLDLVEGEGGWRRYLLYAGSLLVGFGASLTMGLLLPAHALWVAIRAGSLGGRRVVGFALVWLLIAGAAAQWLGVFTERHDVGRAVDQALVEEPPLRGETTMHLLAAPYTFYAFSAGFSLGPTPAELHLAGGAAARRHWPIIVAVALAYGGLALIGLRELIARRPRTALFLLLWIAIPFLLAAWMAAANVKVWNARYLAITFPAFLILAARGLGSLRGRLQAGVLILILGLAVISLWNLRRDPVYAKEDYRSAGAYFDRSLEPGDALIGIGAPAPIFYYAEERPADYLLIHPHRIADEGELRRRLAEAAEGHPRVWLLRVRPYQSDPHNQVGAILDETHVRAERVTFPGIELERYDLPFGPSEPEPGPGGIVDR